MTILGYTQSAGNMLGLAAIATSRDQTDQLTQDPRAQLIGYALACAAYNLFLHPLRHFPGPLLMRASIVPLSLRTVSGRTHLDVLDLHRRYGHVVRTGPGELVFADARAWRDIFGHRAAGEPEMTKARRFYETIENAPVTLFIAPREEHGRLRRQMAHGFSDKAMRLQEPIITEYVDLLLRRLHENAAGGTKAVGMVRWYNYTTFDIVGDLAFGESFQCLEKGDYHPWVAMIFDALRLSAYYQAASFFPVLKNQLLRLAPKFLFKQRDGHMANTLDKVLRRMKMGAGRPDLIDGLLRKGDELNMTIPKLQATSDSLITAGSESTATLLSGVTYLLLKNPAALRRLTEEVRTTFASEKDIDFLSVSALEYMLACLDEALRMYPPAAIGFPRVVPQGGWTIAGHFVPGGTIVSIYQYALYHNEEFFALPEEFHPERWLGDPRFANDDKEVFQPFQYGPRVCLGRNLAYVEMRLILARVLWNFDLRLADDSQTWMEEQKTYTGWEKGPLNVYLTPRFEK